MMRPPPTTSTSRPKSVPLWGWILAFLACFSRPIDAQSMVQLTSEEFYAMATANPVPFNLMIDVRTQSEWNTGHIENATLLAGLQNQLGDGTNQEEVQATLEALGIWNCRSCAVVVYCRSGARAGAALTALEQAGFTGTLYNGLGVSQWAAAGYDLVTTSSKQDWPCMTTPATLVAITPAVATKQVSVRSFCEARPLVPENEGLSAREQEQEMILQELEENKALFAAQLDQNNATSYSFLYANDCFCVPQGYPWLVSVDLQHLMMGMKFPVPSSFGVSNNETTAPSMPSGPEVETIHTVTSAIATMGETSGENLVQTGPSYLSFLSMVDLFNMISDAVARDAASIDVVYNQQWGYPESIVIDYVEMMIDEEMYIRVSNFTISTWQDEFEDNGDEGDLQDDNSTLFD